MTIKVNVKCGIIMKRGIIIINKVLDLIVIESQVELTNHVEQPLYLARK